MVEGCYTLWTKQKCNCKTFLLQHIQCPAASTPDIITDNLTKTCLDAKTWNFAGAIIVQQRCSGRISFMRLPVFLHFLWSHNSCAQLPSQHIVPLLIPIYSVSCTLRLSSSSLKRLGVHQDLSRGRYYSFQTVWDSEDIRSAARYLGP